MPTSINTDQFSAKAFRPHGRAEYEDKGNLLLAKAIGPFNGELMAAVLEMAKITFPAMAAKGPWVHICTFSESALCSLDVLVDLAAALGQMVHAGVAPVVMVFVLPSDVEGAQLMSPLYEKALKDVGVPFKCLADTELAYSWAETFVGPLPRD
jgi:hypothetical protein